MNTIFIRFYEEFNDYLPLTKRKITQRINLPDNQTVKDIIESQGIPVNKVDLIIVNSESVNLNYIIKNNDHISVYPVFESFNISPINKLHEKPLRKTKFILDSHLEDLTKYLRLLGFDCKYKTNYSEDEIIKISNNEKRIILTLDSELLKNEGIQRGYCIMYKKAKDQLSEVIKRFDLGNNT